jgi:light-harvesting complex II chlorophyll a/b binding protein 5
MAMAALAPSKMLGTQLNIAGSSLPRATPTAGSQKIVSLFSFNKKPAPQKAKPATVSSAGPDISDELAKWYGE